MNKSELIDALAPRFASRADAERALTAVLDTISGAVSRDDKVVLPGFGTFERRRRAARKVRNPQTGAMMRTRATHVAAFRPGSQLRERVALGKRGKAFLTDVTAGEVALDAAQAKAERKAAKKLAKASAKAEKDGGKKSKKDKSSKKDKKAKKSRKG